MNKDLLDLIMYLMSELASSSYQKDEEFLYGMHKKESNIFIYGRFVVKKEKTEKSSRTVRVPIKAFLIARDVDTGEYLYDEYNDKDPEYSIKKFKF